MKGIKISKNEKETKKKWKKENNIQFWCKYLVIVYVKARTHMYKTPTETHIANILNEIY